MRILYINHYAGSPRHGMEYRPYYLAREWVRAGHVVQIIGSSQSHIRSKQPQLAGRGRLEETIDDILYTWFETPPYIGNGIGRVRNMGSFVSRLFRESKWISASFRPDVVIASSTYPMDVWPAHRIAKLAGAKLVFEIHDLWPLTPMELGGKSRWHPFIMLMQAAEDYAYRHADAVVSMLPKVRGYVESRGMAPNKLHIVPNGIDPSEWFAGSSALHAAAAEVLSTLHERGYPLIGYAGTHGISNSLETFLSAAKLMREEKVAFVLVGDGPDKARLQKWVSEEQMANICFIDPILKAQIPALLRHFDVAGISWRRQSLYRFGIAPNKLMDYMMAARPVLHAVEAGNDPVSEAGCGLTIPPEDPPAMADGIRALLSLNKDEREAMGQRGKEFVLNNLTYPILAKKFLAACN
ncbi:glycosyltransferase family 4 protein [Massilia sp. Mn16-1_5]|uniref:glycosyltransferase family 4 protein n=1 Tax=Massilia sp. Mn16-1_5 TaxID=2079199 RepID=UPI00109EA945|nr:glycosyltransferase family 4 protein [Massilia sp. Mn16-1_5]THC42568.1 glycosyltransferase WbuB [Massilia sp. Mn16-1_5]